MLHRALSLSLLVVLAGPILAQRAPATKQKADAHVVFVGNSYTFYHDMPAMLRALGRGDAQAKVITTTMVTPGGCTWQRHDGNDKDDGPAATIKEQRPDFVVLQEQSRMPLDDPERMQKFGKRLAKMVAKRRAEPVWYMTWARQHQPERQDEITAQYEQAQRDNGGRLAPVGRAWQLVLADEPKLALHMPDKSHPNPQGSYLAACVLYVTMFGGDVTTFPDKLTEPVEGGEAKVLVELEPKVGARLRAAAKKALGEYPKGKASRRGSGTRR